LEEFQNLPTIDLQKEIPLVKSFWSTRGTKWMEWRGGSHGGGTRLVEEEEERDRVEPFPPTTSIKDGVSGLISYPTENMTENFWSKPVSGPE
jgi:hypothetical protein